MDIALNVLNKNLADYQCKDAYIPTYLINVGI